MAIKHNIRKLMQSMGIDVVRYKPAPPAVPLKPRLARLLAEYKISLVLDVGANAGQFANKLRRFGYRGKIVSFEPLSSAFHELIKCSDADKNWTAENIAIGDKDGTIALNIAGNSMSSSVLEMLPLHRKAAPESAYIGQEEVRMVRLDSVFNTYYQNDSVFLKIDVQGYEKQVLEGAANSLKKIDTIQLEMSLAPLYNDQMLFIEMYEWLSRQGYFLVSVAEAFTDPLSGQVFQVDGIFHRFRDAGSSALSQA